MVNYITLQDYPVRLMNPSRDNFRDRLILTFDLPDEFVQGTNFAIPILLFKAQPINDSRIMVHINTFSQAQSIAQVDHVFDRDHNIKRSFHELISGDHFKPGESNTIVFGAMGHRSGPGGLNSDIFISDVVLFYKMRN